MEFVTKSLAGLLETSGIAAFAQDPLALVMVGVACLLLYLAIVKQFEPLLLLPIAFGMLLTNLLGSEVFHEELFAGGHVNWGLFGGAVMLDGTKISDIGNYWVNAAGNIFTVETNMMIGHFVNAVTMEAGQVSMPLEAVLAQLAENGNAASIVMEHAYYLEGSAVLDSFGNVIATEGGKAISAGLLDFLYLGVKLGIYPCLIFMGVGAMTDFGPLIANPKSLLLGAAAQLGVFLAYTGARLSGLFTGNEAASIGIIGGADGPTAIFVTAMLAPALLGPIAVAAYSYMALVPVIQPPIMKLLTTEKERKIVMKPLREVSKTEKIVFPIVVTIFVALLVPSAAPLVACLMLGNLFKECGVTERLSKAVQNELNNIVVIFLGTTVGATATAESFMNFQTISILCVGIVAFGVGSAGGVLLAKFMNLFLKEKINPLIGSAGVSAVPMAARVSQVEGQKADPRNFLLMHAMGPNVAGVIGSAVAAGILLSFLG